jgi:hypothetical protein
LDQTERESLPSEVSTGRAFRAGAPAAPVLANPVLNAGPPQSVRLTWSSNEALQVFLQRRAEVE